MRHVTPCAESESNYISHNAVRATSCPAPQSHRTQTPPNHCVSPLSLTMRGTRIIVELEHKWNPFL